MAVKSNFASGEILTASDVNTYLTNGGLVYVGEQSLTTVTNTISNVFSSTYENYYVKITGFKSGSTTTRTIRMRIGTDATTNYTWGQRGVFPTNITFDSALTGETSFDIGSSSNNVDNQTFDFWINKPYLATPTTMTGNSVLFQSNIGHIAFRTLFGYHNVSSSFTGFQIIGNTDNLSGTVRVYGYRQP